jgi:hypothetical protein
MQGDEAEIPEMNEALLNSLCCAKAGHSLTVGSINQHLGLEN